MGQLAAQNAAGTAVPGLEERCRRDAIVFDSIPAWKSAPAQRSLRWTRNGLAQSCVRTKTAPGKQVIETPKIKRLKRTFTAAGQTSFNAAARMLQPLAKTPRTNLRSTVPERAPAKGLGQSEGMASTSTC